MNSGPPLEEPALRGLSDAELLDVADARGLVLATYDARDFVVLVEEREQAALPVTGVIVISARRFPPGARGHGPLLRALAAATDSPEFVQLRIDAVTVHTAVTSHGRRFGNHRVVNGVADVHEVVHFGHQAPYERSLEVAQDRAQAGQERQRLPQRDKIARARPRDAAGNKPYAGRTWHGDYVTINGRGFPDTIAPNGVTILPNQPYGSMVTFEP